jgi:hypothetical protein
MLDRAALAMCLRALNAMDLPPGPMDDWAAEPPRGVDAYEEMQMMQEICAQYPSGSDVAFRGEDECRVRFYNVPNRPAHVILLRLVDKTTVNVFHASFSYAQSEAMDKTMNMDDFLFYLRWLFPYENGGNILLNDEYARLKWVRDWCVDDGRLVFYTCVKNRDALPRDTVHFCIRSQSNGWVDHFWMMLPTATDDMRIMQVDTSNNNAFVEAFVTRSDMLNCLLKAANYSSEPQARGAGFADMSREPARHPVAP